MRSQAPWPESVLDSRFVAFPFPKTGIHFSGKCSGWYPRAAPRREACAALCMTTTSTLGATRLSALQPATRSGRFWLAASYRSRFYKIVRPDLRGLGQSEAPDDLEAGLNVEAYIDDLLAIIDALGGGPIHYCGESLGGILGMVLAAQHPQRLRTLSLVAAPLLINQDTQRAFAFDHATWQEALQQMGAQKWAEAANAATRFPADTDPGLLAWYADEMGKSAVEVLIRMSRIASSVDATPFIDRISIPTLGLYPQHAPVTIQSQEQTLKAQCPRSRSSTFPRGTIRSRTSCRRRSPTKFSILHPSTMA